MGNSNSVNDQVRSEMFMQIAEKLKCHDPDLVKMFGGVYLFCLMKKQNVTYWTMDLNKVKIYPGEPEDDQEPEATFTLTEEILEQVAKGKVSARAAVQAGKCSINGNVLKAMKLEPYMRL